MGIIEWLFAETVISREISNSYYIMMLIIMCVAIALAYEYKLKRFSAFLWLTSGLICLIWETGLFLTGARVYTFSPVPELIYHALTEAGPGLIIMVIVAEKLKIIDLTDFRDDNVDTKSSSDIKESENEE